MYIALYFCIPCRSRTTSIIIPGTYDNCNSWLPDVPSVVSGFNNKRTNMPSLQIHQFRNVHGPMLHSRTKFKRNRPIFGGDIVIWIMSSMAAGRCLGFDRNWTILLSLKTHNAPRSKFQQRNPTTCVRACTTCRATLF